MEKRKMYNAYADLEGYNCFGCSPTNPYGLKCKFVDEGELEKTLDPHIFNDIKKTIEEYNQIREYNELKREVN